MLLPTRPTLFYLQSLPCHTVISYTHPFAKQLIHAFKFEGAYSLATLLAQWWRVIAIPPRALLVPVPIHTKRLKQRGYHQTLLLANALAHYTACTVIPDLLIRVINTLPQSSLLPEKRLHALHSAFSINPHATVPLDTPLIIIDDVVTTGATLLECASILKFHGYSHITALVLAHA